MTTFLCQVYMILFSVIFKVKSTASKETALDHTENVFLLAFRTLDIV